MKHVNDASLDLSFLKQAVSAQIPPQSLAAINAQKHAFQCASVPTGGRN
jgi:hypothetical protein